MQILMRQSVSLSKLILVFGCLIAVGCASSSTVEHRADSTTANDITVAIDARDLVGETPDSTSHNALDIVADITQRPDTVRRDLSVAVDAVATIDPDAFAAVFDTTEIPTIGKGGLLEGKAENESEQQRTSLVVPNLDPMKSPRWKLAFSDEFDGPQTGDDPACFSRAPQCLYDVSGGPRDCPSSVVSRLSKLNKCKWSVWNFYNYMNGDETEDGGTNSFRADQIRFEPGMLVLTANSQSGPYDCGRQVPDPLEWDNLSATRTCPFVSGGLSTQGFGNQSQLTEGRVPGFFQKYGRFEVRARLSNGPGTWPAIWMMHQQWSDGWPYDGEIDIMELWADTSKKVTGAFHGGVKADDVHLVDRHPWVAKKDFYPQSDRKKTWHRDFHIFAVEWDAKEMRFYVDKWLIGITTNGQQMKTKSGKYTLKTPEFPFYMLLNITIAPNLGNWLQNVFNDYRPDPDDFTPQRMEIDYVRIYTQCQSPDDFCPWGGTFGTTDCRDAAIPKASYLDKATLYYPKADGVTACPSGGTLDGDKCRLKSYPANAKVRLSNSVITTDSPCVESTISGNCKNPCQGIGIYNGYGCLLGAAPDGFKIKISDGKFYYKQKWLGSIFSPKDCQPEHTYVNGEGCLLGTIPQGRSAFVVNEDSQSRYYLEPTCNAHSGLANCTVPCPAAGTWDGANCYIASAPKDSKSFIHKGGFYIPRVGSDCAAGDYDGANCLIASAPEGTDAFIYQDSFYVKSICGPLPFADATGR